MRDRSGVEPHQRPPRRDLGDAFHLSSAQVMQGPSHADVPHAEQRTPHHRPQGRGEHGDDGTEQDPAYATDSPIAVAGRLGANRDPAGRPVENEGAPRSSSPGPTSGDLRQDFWAEQVDVPMPIVSTRSPGRATSAIRFGTAPKRSS